MKKIKIKLITFVVIMLMAISIIQIPSLANTNKRNIILKKANEEFLIYYEDICNNEFQFAFSDTENEQEENLSFINSIKDQSTNEALNVAYIDKNLYNKFFTSGSSYLWIKNSNDETILKADKIDLSNAIDDSIIQMVNTTTKRIDVDTTQTYETSQVINEATITVTVGKVVVKAKPGAKYYYKLVKTADDKDTANLFDLAELTKIATTNTFSSLDITKQFSDLYTKLTPTDKEWKEVENGEILQPEDTKDGDKYVVWIKEELDNTKTIDAKFLTSVYKQNLRMEPTQQVLTEVVKLPVTFDQGEILFAILGILIVALVIFLIVKSKINKKDEKK